MQRHVAINMDINTKLIKQLAQILAEQGLSEMEIDQNGTRIKLSREFKGSPMFNTSYNSSMTMPAMMPQEYMPLDDGNKNIASQEYSVDNSGESVVATIAAFSKTINAKMVGLFYSASTPESEPFVTVGQKVQKGDVICIIEAMKTMNEIVAEYDCEIVEIIAQNGHLVEHGQALFAVK